MASKIVSKECLCSFAAILGDAKDSIIALMDALIVTLTVLRTYLQLFNVSIEDQLRRIEYEAELLVLQSTIETLELPFRILLGYTRTFADCSPVATVAATIKEVRNKVISPVKERQYEIEQYLLALEDKDAEIEWINRTIDVLGEVKTALNECEEI